jgi:hypothetical protein
LFPFHLPDLIVVCKAWHDSLADRRIPKGESTMAQFSKQETKMSTTTVAGEIRLKRVSPEYWQSRCWDVCSCADFLARGAQALHE